MEVLRFISVPWLLSVLSCDACAAERVVQEESFPAAEGEEVEHWWRGARPA